MHKCSLFSTFQRPDKEQKDLLSRWTELGTDGPGMLNYYHCVNIHNMYHNENNTKKRFCL